MLPHYSLKQKGVPLASKVATAAHANNLHSPLVEMCDGYWIYHGG